MRVTGRALAEFAAWARPVWLAGWDDMVTQYGAREH